MSYRGDRGGRGRGAGRGSGDRGGGRGGGDRDFRGRGGGGGGRGSDRGGRGDFRGGRGDFRSRGSGVFDRGGGRGGGGGGGPREQGGIFAENVPSTLDARLTDGSQDELIANMEPVTNKSSDTRPEIPTRPDFGTVAVGPSFKLRTNFFPVRLPKKTIFDYEITITPGVTAKGVKRRIFQLAEATNAWTQHGLKGKVAHDFSSKLVAVNKLPDPLVIKVIYVDDDGDVKEKRRPEEYTLTFKFMKDLDTSKLIDFLAGEGRINEDLPMISALNLILSSFPNSPVGQGVMVGRNKFFFKSGELRPVNLGGGLEAWKGFYSSVRPAWKQLMVNVNVCTTAFYQPQNLAVAMMQFQESSFGARASTFVKRVRVKTTHLGYKKTVSKLARVNARQYRFDSGDFGTVTVEEYFKKKYNIILRHPELELVDVGGKKRNLLPPEVCEILPDQRFPHKLTDEHTGKMIKVAARPPNVNAGLIVDEGLKNLGFKQSAGPLNAFGIGIGQEMAVVPGRLLPAPGIHYGQGKPKVDEKASWNPRAVKFAVGGRLADWAVIIINDGNPDSEFQGVNDPELKKTVKGLADMCRTSGMRVEGNPLYGAVHLPGRSKEDPVRGGSIRAIRAAVKQQFPKKPSMILIVLSNSDVHVFHGIKYLLDVELQVPNICVQASKIRKDKGQLQYFGNVALKINMKMGGVNHRLVDPPGSIPTLTWLKDPTQPTMLVGMDVTHPTGSDTVKWTPSIAAVVATIDNNFAQLPASLRIQKSKQEMIADLTSASRGKSDIALRHW